MKEHPRIRAIIDKIIEREGGYVNNQNDAGGPTMYGVTERVARAWGYEGPMHMLSRSLAAKIYLKQYFEDPGFAHVLPLSVPIAAELTDTEVNLPPRRAGAFLQRALNVCNRMGRSYADIVVDGIVGPATANALRAFLSVRGGEGEQVMLSMLNCQLGEYYIQRCEAREKNEEFVYGWFLHRVMEPAL